MVEIAGLLQRGGPHAAHMGLKPNDMHNAGAEVIVVLIYNWYRLFV